MPYRVSGVFSTTDGSRLCVSRTSEQSRNGSALSVRVSNNCTSLSTKPESGRTSSTPQVIRAPSCSSSASCTERITFSGVMYIRAVRTIAAPAARTISSSVQPISLTPLIGSHPDYDIRARSARRSGCSALSQQSLTGNQKNRHAMRAPRKLPCAGDMPPSINTSMTRR